MNDVIKLAKSLISCPSITPNDSGCQDLIRKRLEQTGFQCESLKFEEVDNLWARYGKHSPLFVFAGHTDVVPSGPETDWTANPFMPEIRGNYLYGRGAADMKTAVACMIVAAENFIKEQPHFPGSLAFLITSDEEGAALNGTKKVMEFLKNRQEKIDYCIVGEPSSQNQVGDQIRIGRRGSLHGKLTIHGKQGHVAHPHLAKNPIHLSALLIHKLAETQWDNGNEDFPPTTFQITNIHSGTGAANVIPGHLEILFNFRFGTASTVDELKKKVEKMLNEYHLDYHLEWKLGAEPFLTQKGKLIKATQQAIYDISQQEVKLSTGGGTSDGRFIAPTGAELLELGVSHATAHQVDECVKIEDISILTLYYQKILNYLFL